MAATMYSLQFDPTADLLEIRWHRTFTPADVLAYKHELMRRFLDERVRPGHRLMIDMSACGAQMQETLAALAEHMRPFPRASRIAMVAVSPVLRAQVRRVMKQPYMTLFDDAQAARAWLMDPAAA
ncbi:MAG: STAS/SEC14 domain-containing protein [Sphingomonas phyllosphaerae]|uniref:STAS/SEC14 domain-containing protein n=1 Tax=Sphingomonas phyllosphaerae TaxID=257003 RepID=UPI002FFAA7E6